MQSSIHSPLGRLLAWLLVTALLSAGCSLAPVPDPKPGLPEFQTLGLVSVPGGVYSVAGRNLMVQRSDVSVDTRILAGTSVGATYNSATKLWHWSYEMSFDGETFVDREGAVFHVAALADGAAIPGTYWVRVDADTVKTKGGLVFDFDGQGRLDAVYWSSDPYPRHRYVRDPAFIELRECAVATLPIGQCRLVFTIDLGPSGPTRIVDEESAKVGVTREARYGYDPSGRLATARTPFEVDEGLPGTRYEYGSSGLLSAVTRSEGERIEYRWYFGWLAQVTQVGEGNPSHGFTYPQVVDRDAGLYSVVHVNPFGGRTRYTFTGAGHVTEIDRLDSGEVTTVTWDQASNRPTQVVGFDGTLEQFQGWVDDDPTTVIEASGNVVQLAYEPDGVDFDAPFRRPIASVSDSLGPVAAVTYDAAGRPDTRANGEGDAATLDYLGGEVSMATMPWGGTIDLVSYGVHGHWRTAKVSWVPETSVQRKFDRVGNLVVPGAGLQEGGVLERAYGPDRQLASLEVGATDENGAVTATGVVSVTRRSDGQPLSVSRPRGADHVMEYDALGRISRVRERVDGSWKDTTYEYDSGGSLSALEKPNGMREELDYDPYGRTVERRVLRDGVVEASVRFEWGNGRLERWYDSTREQWETFGYDAAGRPHTITYSALGETLTYDYDVRSRTIRKTFQFGAIAREIEMEWDLADRRTRVFTRDGSGGEQDLVRLDYQQGRLAAVEYGNGLRRELLFEPETNQFAGFRTTRISNGEQVEETTITREARTGPTRLEVTSWTETPLATTQEQYWLGLGGNLQNPDSKIGARVFRWHGWSWIGGVLQDEDEQAYAWDELSNRVDDADGDVLGYDPERNRLLSASVHGVSHTYAYDDAGYATSRDGLPITWTAAGRLATLGPAANPAVELEWDLAGRPVSATVLGATREFALFGGRVEYDSGTGEVGWLHLADVSLPFQGGARIYRHFDPLGNVSFTTDWIGNVTSHRRYHPFGLDRVYGGDSFSDDDHHGFAGGIELRHDGITTGLVVLGARVLDSDVGRFLSPDPVFDLMNSYTYAYGNPVRYEDDDGRRASAKAEPSASDAVSAALDAISAYFYFTASLLGAVGAVNAAYGNAPAAGFAFAGGAVLAVFGSGFQGAATAVRFVQTATERGQTGTPPPPPASIEGGPSVPGGPGKIIELQPEFSLGVGIAPCVSAPMAGPIGTDSRWHWIALQLLVLLYMGWHRRPRRSSSATRGSP